MDFVFVSKIILFTILQYIPLYIWYKLAVQKNIVINWRLVVSYFIFGSWFGMFGELFLFKVIEWLFQSPIWEYRTLPIHNGITSSYGPIMWGNAAVYICFHKNYSLNKKANPSVFVSFIKESLFLLVLELLFNFLAFCLFQEYFFYYFVPDLWHWSSFTNLPFWWVGYQVVVKYSNVLYKEEKLNLAIAAMMIVIAFAYQ
jgi:hypothetical protein